MAGLVEPGRGLAMGVTIHGPADASKVLMTTSVVHGSEGFCGSATQTGLLQITVSLPPDVAVVQVLAVNPYGFSHARRVNEDGVDLNRNFIDFAFCEIRTNSTENQLLVQRFHRPKIVKLEVIICN